MTKRKFGSISSHDAVDRRGFWHPLRGLRQFRRRTVRPHFTTSVTGSMDVTTTPASTRRNTHHEAHMIPGVDGNRTWGFPNSIMTKLRYSSYYTLSHGAAARGINVFAANGLFDPDLTGTGHQPMYYDQYTALYNHYVVIGSKITVNYAPATAAQNFLVGIDGDDDSSVTTGVETLLERNNAVSTLLPALGGGSKTLVMTFEPNEDFGVDAIADGESSTATNANPTELWCYGVWAAGADITTSGSVNVLVEIEYTVRFSELRDPTQS